MACKYLYQGVAYSRPEMIRMVATGQVSREDSTQAARNWLESTLGINEAQIEVIRGLIEGRAMGRMLSTGKILLSSLADMDTAYEEGFHYFFDFLATEEERKTMWEEMSSRPYAKDQIKKLKELYPDYDDVKLMKEVLAKDFAVFAKAEGEMNLPKSQKSFFQKLWNFLKAILGIGRKPVSLHEIYSAVLAGRYKTRQFTPNEGATEQDSRSSVIPITVRGELAQNLSTRLFQAIVDAGVVQEFIEGRIDEEEVGNIFYDAVSDLITQEIEESDPQLALAIVADTTTADLKIREESELYQNVKSYLEKIGFRMKGLVEEDTPSMDDIDEVDPENENEMVKDRAFNKVAFEFDPRSDVRRSTAVMINSIFDPSNTSQRLGIAKPLSYNEVTSQLFHHLSGVPAKWSIVKAELEKNYNKVPWFKDIVDTLDKDLTNPYNVRAITEFMLSFTKNRYRFTKAIIKQGRVNFVNLASDSLTKKYVRTWGGRVDLRSNDKQALIRELKGAVRPMQIAQALGFDELDDFMINLPLSDEGMDTVGMKLTTLRDVIVAGLEKGVDVSKIFNRQPEKFAEYEIRGSVNQIAEVVAQHGRPLDLMLLNSERKRIYSISLHSFQTQVVGTLNWIARSAETYEERLEMLKMHLPHLNTQYLIREDGTVRSEWLRNILNGIPLTVEVFDGAQARRILRSGSSIKANDMLAFHINAIQEGRMFSFKHGDRSTLFAYKFDRKHSIPARGLSSSLSAHVETALDYLDAELSKLKLVRESNYLKGVQNWSKRGMNPSIFPFLTASKVEGALKQGWDKNRLRDLFAEELRMFFEQNAKATADAIEDGNIATVKGRTISSNGIDSQTLAAYGTVNRDGLEVEMEIALNSFALHFFSYIEQTMVFTGDPSNYKSAVDFYKRIQMQSSTGNPMATGQEIDDMLLKMQDRDKIEDNRIDGATYGDLKIPGYISELVMDLPKTDSMHLEQLKDTFKSGLYNDYISQGITPEEADLLAEKLSQEWADSYKGYDENDGQSYINIFFWREYEVRQGTWNDAKENTFQLELAIFNSPSLSDTRVWLNVNNMFDVKAHWEAGAYMLIDPFDVESVRQVTGINDYQEWFNTVFDYGSVKKPQYTGPLVNFDPNAEVPVIAGRKTSYATLFPSVIAGTNLEKINRSMITKGIDVVHMLSGAKYGVSKDLSIPPESYNLYNDGKLNDFSQADKMVTYLEMQYLKDQVAIHNRPKSRIKNATQSAKIILSNLYSGGVPKDYKGAMPFESLTLLEKIDASPIFAKVHRYSQRVNEIMQDNMEALVSELGEDKVQSLGNIVRKNAESKGEPTYILESIDLFVKEQGLELLPNWQRIESLLYSIVTNNAVVMERLGDGKAQFASTMWERSATTRGTNESGIISSDTLKFYSVEKDESGKIVQVNPAECIIPLDPKKINWLLNWSGKSSLVEALDWYEKLPDSKKIVFKGLRIPNQQLSFNEVLRVKEFGMPTFQSYIVLPSESVVKSGSDHDADKIQMYMPAMVDRPLNEDEIKSNELLDAEIQLLLDPVNAHHLLAPSSDTWLKEGIFSDVMSLREGVSKEDVLAARENYVLRVTDDTLFSLVTNVVNGVKFLESKANVGLGATSITGQSVDQTGGVAISDTILLPDEDGNFTVEISTKMPFEGASGRMDSILDSRGNFILERFSGILTSQVDALKDNYAAAIELTDQTIPLVIYMMRQRVPAEVAIKLVNVPLIREYLKMYRQNNSLVTWASDSRLDNDYIPTETILKTLKVGNRGYTEHLQRYEKGQGEMITEEELDNALKQGRPSVEQFKMLASFVQMMKVMEAVRYYMRDFTADTKGRGNRDSVQSFEYNFENLIKTQFAPAMSHRKGFLAPAYRAQNLYNELFKDLYIVPIELVDEISRPLSKFKAPDEVARIRAKVANDFILYALQNYHPRFKEYTFERLFVGRDSIARKLLQMQGDVNLQYVMDHLLPLLNETVDNVSGRKVDVVKVAERGASTQQLDDLYEAFSELPEELQEELIFLSLHQAGLSRSPFSLDVMLNASKLSSIVSTVREKVQDILNSESSTEIEVFRQKFYFNNPNFLPTSRKALKKLGYYARINEKTGEQVIYVAEAGVFYPLGNQYYLRYQTDVFAQAYGEQPQSESNESVPEVEDENYFPTEEPIQTQESYDRSLTGRAALDSLREDMAKGEKSVDPTSEDPNKYYQVASKPVSESKAVKALDDLLIEYLAKFKVKVRDINELKEQLEIDALGVADILNKVIYLAENREADTLPEEAAHMVIMLMGQDHPDVGVLMRNIMKWEGYAQVEKDYLELYKGNYERVRFEAVGKLLAKNLVEKFPTKEEEGIFRKLINQLIEAFRKLFGMTTEQTPVPDIIRLPAERIASKVLEMDAGIIPFKPKYNYVEVNAVDALTSDPDALMLHADMVEAGGTLTGSLAIAAQAKIYRDKDELIHDLDYEFNSDQDVLNAVKAAKKRGGVFLHSGIPGKDYFCFSLLVPKSGWEIAKANRYWSGWQKGMIIRDSMIFKNIKTGKYYKYHESLFTAVDIFRTNKRGSEDGFLNFDEVFAAKQKMNKQSKVFFRRVKDQIDYVTLETNRVMTPKDQYLYYQKAPSSPSWVKDEDMSDVVKAKELGLIDEQKC